MRRNSALYCALNCRVASWELHLLPHGVDVEGKQAALSRHSHRFQPVAVGVVESVSESREVGGIRHSRVDESGISMPGERAAPVERFGCQPGALELRSFPAVGVGLQLVQQDVLLVVAVGLGEHGDVADAQAVGEVVQHCELPMFNPLLVRELDLVNSALLAEGHRSR